MANEDHKQYPEQAVNGVRSNECDNSLIDPILKDLGRGTEEDGQSRETTPTDSDRLPEILTSPWPEEMQAPEDPNQFLPDTIDYTKIRACQIAEWKARAPNCHIIEDYVRPRLINVPRTNAKKSNAGHCLNEMERKWRGRRAIFTANWILGVNGKMPAVTQKNFDKLSDLQLLYRTWGEIDLATLTHKVQGHTYALRAPRDIPPKACLALDALNRAIPMRWAHLKAHPHIWQYFDVGEYEAHLRTEALMDADPGDDGWLDIMSRTVDVLDPFGGLGLPERGKKRVRKEGKGKGKGRKEKGRKEEGEEAAGENMAKCFGR